MIIEALAKLEIYLSLARASGLTFSHLLNILMLMMIKQSL